MMDRDTEAGKHIPRRWKRRQFLIAGGSLAGLVALTLTGCGGSETPPTSASSSAAKPSAAGSATTSAPSSAAGSAVSGSSSAAAASTSAVKGGEIKLLQWLSFVPEMDQVFIKQLNEWGQKNGYKVTVDRISLNDMIAKLAAEVQAGAGHDVFQTWFNQTLLYPDAFIDVSKEAEALGKKFGGYYEQMENHAKIDGVWRAIPYAFVPGTQNYRVSWFKEAGYDKFPDTIDEYTEAAKKLHAAKHPVGQALGHAIGDATTFWYPILWAFGGKEVEKDGKTVALNSPETQKALEWAQEFFKYNVPGVLSWDDSSNNRAFLANQISATLNGASIYFAAKKSAPKIADDMNHALMPKGTAGRFSYHTHLQHGIFKWSKVQDAAKEMIMWAMQPEQYSPWLQTGNGFDAGPLHFYDNDPVWSKDPKVVAFKDILQFSKWAGYPGPASARAAEVQANYMIVDMFAKVASGEYSPKESMDWASKQLEGVYGRK